MATIKYSITEIIKDNTVEFLEYRKGYLYYVVSSYLPIDKSMLNQRIDYKFPVPIEECGDATFRNKDKAIFFMRYIKRAIEDGTFIQVT